MTSLILLLAAAQLPQTRNLIQNSTFERVQADGKTLVGFELAGAARRDFSGYLDETTGQAVALDSFASRSAGSVSQLVTIDRTQGKWVTFRVRARAEDGFAVRDDALWLQIDFYAKHGAQYEDTVRRLVYREIIKDRKDLAVNGDDHRNGAAVWRTYELEELLPFSETDAVKVSVGFKEGAGTDKAYSKFVVSEFALTQAGASATGRVDPADRVAAENIQPRSISDMISLGGRWFYRPARGEAVTTNGAGRLAQRLVITEANADRLFYRNDRLGNPFAGNMTAWVRKGYLDEQGSLVNQDRFVPDNVTVTFDGSDAFTVEARNIPNHPTAKFPDTYGTQGYNPSYIQAKLRRYRLPIDPKQNPNATAMTADNSNMGLNMGSIGIAVNGVVFYNPFDANMTDASGIMDRCCGHPSQDNRYHYHKYPICVNTPFVDKGDAHSPLIGFAFDGFPIYGPYESSGVMAKDLTTNKLNAFNLHFDEVRGWHYHVTPGKFPYIIGGYFGTVEREDLDQRGPGRGFGPAPGQ